MNKYPYIFPEEAPLIILDIRYGFLMGKNGKDTKHTRNISRRVHFLRNGEKFKMYRIDWCEGGLQLADIATDNFDNNDLNRKIKYIMVRLDN